MKRAAGAVALGQHAEAVGAPVSRTRGTGAKGGHGVMSCLPVGSIGEAGAPDRGGERIGAGDGAGGRRGDGRQHGGEDDAAGGAGCHGAGPSARSGCGWCGRPAKRP